MARMSPEDRRTAIIAATLVVMRRRGIGGTTVRDVAAELGTSSGLIHHYVDTMDDLIAEAFAEAAGADLAATIDAVEMCETPQDRLRGFVDSYSRSDDLEGMQLWLDAWAEAARRPALQRTSRELNERWQALLAGILRDADVDGLIDVADVEAAAWRILSLLDGLLLQVAAHGDVLSREQADQWARDGIERELGLAPGSLATPL